MKTDEQQRVVTLDDVARLAGVARSTASSALAGKGGKYAVAASKREAVLEAARALGYEINPHAQRLAVGRCSNIGLFMLAYGYGFTSTIFQGLHHQLAERGYPLTVSGVAQGLSSQHPDQSELIGDLRRQKVRAIVISTVRLSRASLDELRRYRDEGGLVLCYHHPVGEEWEQVILDEEENSYRATRYLLELGHQRIGLCQHGAKMPHHPHFRGVVRALAERGLELRDEDVFHGGLHHENGARLAASFLAMPSRPTALHIVEELAAGAFVNEVQRAGLRVPHDVSVVGHGDRATAHYGAVRLTAVDCPVQQMVENVVELLCNRIEGEYDGPPRRRVISGHVVERESAAPLGSEKPNFHAVIDRINATSESQEKKSC